MKMFIDSIYSAIYAPCVSVQIVYFTANGEVCTASSHTLATIIFYFLTREVERETARRKKLFSIILVLFPLFFILFFASPVLLPLIGFMSFAITVR